LALALVAKPPRIPLRSVRATRSCSPDGAQHIRGRRRAGGKAAPHSASLHAGYRDSLSALRRARCLHGRNVERARFLPAEPESEPDRANAIPPSRPIAVTVGITPIGSSVAVVRRRVAVIGRCVAVIGTAAKISGIIGIAPLPPDDVSPPAGIVSIVNL